MWPMLGSQNKSSSRCCLAAGMVEEVDGDPGESVELDGGKLHFIFLQCLICCFGCVALAVVLNSLFET